MYRTDRIRIGERHELCAYLDDFAHKAKCLHNASLFRIRNTFTAHDKKTLTSNETEVQNELALLNGQKTYYVLGYGVLQRLMRVTSNPVFFQVFQCRQLSILSDNHALISKHGLRH